MRVYIPVTVADVERRRSDGYWTISARRAWAVNQVLARALPDEDDEGREYVASLTAASDSPAHLAVAADLPTSMIGDEGTNGEVVVSGVIADNLIACLLRIDADDDEALLWFAPSELDGLLNQ